MPTPPDFERAEGLREEVERLRATLREIAQMKLQNDQGANTLILHCAIEVAKNGLEK